MKEVLQEGGYIEFPYKTEETEWVGTAAIRGFSLGYGIKPKIVVEIGNVNFAIGGRKEYSWDSIDEAVSDFTKFVLSPDNLCHKQKEAMLQLYNEGYHDLDLDNPEDLKLVRDRQKKLQSIKQNGGS